ncbi:MAG: cycloartenol synthase, partial [Lentisphaeria bacterium]
TWVVSDREEEHMDGGFIYKPDESKVNEKLRDQGTEVEGLRSYGSMTYAGLKSMIYAELDKDDHRVEAAVDWARKHYTLDENPVMGAEGHFYYLQTFAKAMAAYDVDVLETADKGTRNWREDLISKLLDLQKESGQWQNDKSGRWMESIPDLTTSYAMIAIEVALEDLDISAE